MICQEYENATFKLIKGQSCYHRETSQLIANQLTVFYMMTILAFNELNPPLETSYILVIYVKHSVAAADKNFI